MAHPGLVPVAMEIFDEHMKTPNQIDVKREDVHVTAAGSAGGPRGRDHRAGPALNIDVGMQYLESWLRGIGCVPIYNLMEDAATAEISRAQVWQWMHHGSQANDGRTVTAELVRATIPEQLAHIKSQIGAERYDAGKFQPAAQLFEQMMTSSDLKEFLTLEAYKYL